MYCKWPDKTVLEPSLILYVQVTQPMSNMFLFYVVNVFIGVLKHVLCFFYSKIYVLTTMISTRFMN